ncbi:MAG: hypothetical protein J6K20_00060 [Thermoguttaceae bacterium]|nr:hypothetical protein [Thermoguttaceae bacterium]
MKENEEKKTEGDAEKLFTFVVKRVYLGSVTVYARDEDEAWERFEKEGWEKGYSTEDYFEIESDDVLKVEEDVVDEE